MIKVILKSFVHFPFSTTLYIKNGWSLSETDKILGLRGANALYTGYSCLLSVQISLRAFSAFQIFDNIILPTQLDISLTATLLDC